MSAPATAPWIISGENDPRDPLVIPANRAVNSMYIQTTAGGAGFIAVYFWKASVQRWTMPIS